MSKMSEKMPERITIWSESFRTRDKIPKEYTCDGRDISPPLSWTGIPSNTVSIAIIMEDPDAPHIFTHWTIYNIYSNIRKLPASIPKTPDLSIWPLIGNGFQGITDFGEIGYGGPCPPPGKPHRYFFWIYALDMTLNLPPGASKREIEIALNEHILAIGDLMGTYMR